EWSDGAEIDVELAWTENRNARHWRRTAARECACRLQGEIAESDVERCDFPTVLEEQVGSKREPEGLRRARRRRIGQGGGGKVLLHAQDHPIDQLTARIWIGDHEGIVDVADDPLAPKTGIDEGAG